jgi:hypothetical protein
MNHKISYVSVKAKLIFVFTILSLVIIFLAGQAIRDSVTSSKLAETADNILDVRFGRTNAVMTAIREGHLKLQNMCISGSAATQEQADALNASLDAYEKAAADLDAARFPQEVGSVKQVSAQYATVVRTAIIPKLVSGDLAGAREDLASTLDPMYLSITGSLSDVISKQVDQADDAAASIESNITVTAALAAALVLVCAASRCGFPEPSIPESQRCSGSPGSWLPAI